MVPPIKKKMTLDDLAEFWLKCSKEFMDNIDASSNRLKKDSGTPVQKEPISATISPCQNK
jgi:hypothetical protein